MDNYNANDNTKIVLFSLETSYYALYLNVVNRVINSVEVSPLPKAPSKIFGIINLQGEVIPVINLRNVFRLNEKEVHQDDHFMITKIKDRHIVLAVDTVIGVYEIDKGLIENADNSLPYTEYLSGVTLIENDIVLIYDLGNFLSLEEYKVIDKAIKDVGK